MNTIRLRMSSAPGRRTSMVLLALAVLAPFALASDAAPAPEASAACRAAIRAILDVPADPERPISPEVAQAIHGLDTAFSPGEEIGAGTEPRILRLGVPSVEREECRRYAAHVFGKAWETFGVVLDRQLERSVQVFHRDLSVLMTPWPDPQRWALIQSDAIRPLVNRYSEALYSQVRGEVRTLRDRCGRRDGVKGDRESVAASRLWESWLNRSPRFVPWSAEWTRKLGRPSPAAVDLVTSEIAVQPYSLSPEDMKLILFHEIAHLTDPRYLQGGSLFENEVYAWRSTLTYLRIRETCLKWPLPPLAREVRAFVRQYGLKGWVRKIWSARGRHAH